MALITLWDIYDRVAWDTGMAYVSQTEHTESMFLANARIIAQDIQSELVYSQDDTRNWDMWYTDTVSLQDEYTKPAVSSDTVGADRIDSISVAYQSDTYTQTGLLKYVPCRKATVEEQRNWEYLLENQPKESPIYFQADKSVFIAPDPRSTEVGTNRLKITGARSIATGAWTASTTELEIKLPLQFIDVLTLGCVWKANAQARKDRSIVIDSKNEYIQEKRKAIKSLNLEVSSIMWDDKEVEQFITL